MDISTAFLKGLEFTAWQRKNTGHTEVVMEIPTPVRELSEFKGRLSCKYVRLNRSIYGCKEAPRAFQISLSTCMLSAGFQAMTIDECAFVLLEEEASVWEKVCVGDDWRD